MDVEELYEVAPCGYLSTTAEGALIRVNSTLLSWTGHSRDELAGRRFVDLLTPGSRIYHETHYAPLLQMQQGAREIAFTMLRKDGTRFPVLVNSRVIPGPDGQPVVLTSVFDATDRHRYEEELLLARRRAEQATEQLGRMQRVTLRIALASGVGQVGTVTARSAVEVGGAAVAAVWLREDRQTFALAARATGPTVERPEPAQDAGTSPGRAEDGVLTGEDVPASRDLVVMSWEEGEHRFGALTSVLASPDDVGDHAPGRTLVLAPLLDGQGRLGVLGCRLDVAGPLDPAQVDAIRTLCGQAAVALVRAQLFEQQRHVAETLQRSLLPATLPESPDFSLARVYLPGQTGTQAGGDWYDAYRLGDDLLALVVGDVVGRGVNAAATMGQLRSAVRALAPVSQGPAELLTRLDRFAEAVPSAVCATVVYAVLDLVAGRLTYACAGHPPPLLLEPSGPARPLWGGRSLPLGIGPVVARGQDQVDVARGSRLLLYTDGLVERRDVPLDERIDRLARELTATREIPVDAQVRALAQSMLGPDDAPDDVCVLGLSLHAAGAEGR